MLAVCASGGDVIAALVGAPHGVVVVVSDEIASPEVLGEIAGWSGGARVLVMASDTSAQREVELVGFGVGAVLRFGASQPETLRAVEALLAGTAVVSVEALGLIAASPMPEGPPMLTGRQRQVLELLATGQSTQQIASRLVVTPSTVKTHLRVIGERFGLAGQRALAVNAHRLLNPDVAVTLSE